MEQLHTFNPFNQLSSRNKPNVMQRIMVMTLFIIPIFMLSACMEDDYDAGPAELCPDVETTVPADGDMNVDITQEISVTFNKKMCADSVKDSFHLLFGDDEVTGEVVTDDDQTFRFIPESNLHAKTGYTAVVGVGVADCFGLTLLDGEYEWEFQTRNEALNIVETLPPQGAQNVVRNPLVRLTFDRALNPETLEGKFRMEDSSGNEVELLGWEYDNKSVVFITENLKASETYEAVLMQGVEDLSGYFLEDDFEWDFATGPEFEMVPRAVNLKSLTQFAIFSSDLIQNVGTTNVTGDVGIIPGNIADIMGDPLTVDGDVLADGVDPVDIINPILIKGQNDLFAAYLFAELANNPPPQPVSGNDFTPGIYHTNDFDIDQTITLDAENDPNAFWIFQISGDLTVANNIQIDLINGAHANNVFWQVGNDAAIGSGVMFKGSIMALNDIEVQNGADITGRLMVKTGGIYLNANTIQIP